MLVCRLLLPPVTTTSPLGKIATPGQNMSWPVLLTVRWLTCPVVRSQMAVCVMLWPRAEFMVVLEDHTRSLLPGKSAAATGTSGNPIVGPHSPTTDGFVLRVGALGAPKDGGDCTSGAPCSEIAAAATEDPEPAAYDSAVSLTKRVV